MEQIRLWRLSKLGEQNRLGLICDSLRRFGAKHFYGVLLWLSFFDRFITVKMSIAWSLDNQSKRTRFGSSHLRRWFWIRCNR